MARSTLREWRRILQGNALWLIVSWCIIRAATSISGEFEPKYIQELGGSAAIAGFITALYWLITGFTGLIGGYVGDRFGRYRVVVSMTFVVGIIELLFAAVPNWYIYLLLDIIAAACHFYVPALHALFADSVPPELRGRAYVLSSLLPLLTSIASPSIGGWLYATYGLWGLRLAFIVSGVGVLIGAFVRALFVKETLRRPLATPSFLPAIRNALLWTLSCVPALLTVAILFHFCWGVASIYFIYYAIDIIGLSPALYGIISSATIATNLLISPIAGHLIDKWGRRYSLLLGTLPIPFALLLFIHATEFWTTLLALITVSSGGLIVWHAFAALLADSVPRERRGRVFSIFELLEHACGAAPALLVGGMLYDYNPVLPFLLSALLYTAMLALITLRIYEPTAPEA